MKKIDKFPKGFDIAEVREKWLAVGRTTERADRPKMEAAVKRVYKISGLKEPEMFIWMESPYQGGLAAWIAHMPLEHYRSLQRRT